MYDAVFDTKIGKLGIKISGNFLQAIDFDVNFAPFSTDNQQLNKIGRQLNAFLSRQKQEFSLNLMAQGTEFQMRVWKALQHIPYGEKRTYGELATELNSSARAVGNACRRNPIPIVIPCHRVIAKTGIGGFSGETEGFQIDRKKYLLKLEAGLLNDSEIS